MRFIIQILKRYSSKQSIK